MEKRRAPYELGAIQAIVARDGVVTFTQTALAGAVRLGLSGKTACDIVCGLTRRMFYKIMTTHADSRIWQDVYHAPLASGKFAYIKLTLTESGRVVIQFKEQ